MSPIQDRTCLIVAACHTTNRRAAVELCSLRVVASVTDTETVFARCEMDTHADTCALGRNFIPLSYTGRVCDVSPYNAEAYESERNVPIVTGATAYQCQESGQTYILLINEGLWLGPKLRHSLLNPNQLRFNSVSVWDNPFDPNQPLSIEHDEATIPLAISGTNIFMETRTPTQHELDTCPHLQLTSETAWNPHTVRLASTHSVEAEETVTNFIRLLLHRDGGKLALCEGSANRLAWTQNIRI